jgi:Domain of unknown function (DUF4258)
MYTNHARIRMNERCVTPTEIEQCIKKGSWVFCKNGVYGRYYQGLMVVFHPISGLVITVWKGVNHCKENIHQPIKKDKKKYTDDKHVLRTGFSRFDV